MFIFIFFYVIFFAMMVNTRLEVQRQIIQHYWLNGINSAKEIQKKTGIPLRTIERNLKKLRETGNVNHQCNNGQKSKVTQTISRTIGQHMHKNTAVSTCQLAAKVQNTHDISISHASIWRHIKKKGYESSVPLATLMLTNRHIKMRKAWAQAHLNDN